MSWLDKLPGWNKAIGKGLEPLGPVLDVCLLAVAAVCVWAVVKKWTVQAKALWLAYLISP